MTLTVTRSSCGGDLRVLHGAEQPQASRRFVRVPGGHFEFREQLGAAQVPCDGRGVVQENDTAVADGTYVLLKAGPGLSQEFGETVPGVR